MESSVNLHLPVQTPGLEGKWEIRQRMKPTLKRFPVSSSSGPIVHRRDYEAQSIPRDRPGCRLTWNTFVRRSSRRFEKVDGKKTVGILRERQGP